MIKKLTVLLKEICQQGYICGMSDDSDFENQENKFLDEVRCKNCRYWGMLRDWEDPEHYFPQFPEDSTHKRCGNKIIDGDDSYEYPQISSYEEVGMAPDFGCINFELKGE